MLKMKKLDKNFEDAYFKIRKGIFDSIIKTAGFDAKNQTGWVKANIMMRFFRRCLRTIILGSPEDLLKLIAIFDTHFPEILRYHTRKNKKNTRDPHIEKMLAIIQSIFDYSTFIKNRDSTKHGAYQLINKHAQRICPYCHLHHVNYHIDSKLTMRPPLDHFYPQSVYPWLAVSLYNLVPSCDQCNSKIKLAKNPLATHVPNPFGQDFVDFSIDWIYGMPLSKKMTRAECIKGFSGRDPYAKAFDNFFKLNERYSWYDKEVIDKIEICIRYNDLPSQFTPDIISMKEFICGFEPSERDQRALGIFTDKLADILIEHCQKYPNR
ncbi:hypothetical protein TH60_16555 [Pantoea ananatis]|uniref:hypothetical protein n=1 Tax=Pantoea TaxID=53335 RepID=UPI001EE5CF28|nr:MULTISPECIES: hypothetical protein [Pantoea]MDC7871105.1 hypothetical protein [Pantoea ananatis]MDI3416655.1 hypothetical protein [Pantoea sp. V106_11]MDI6535862.1 hypothetical protein [Pantoea ananatis]PKC40860.1 hypothetical protein V461_18220 [Pantoea ananatis BRT98]